MHFFKQLHFFKQRFFKSSAPTVADEITPVTSIYRLGEPSAEERFYARRNRRAAQIWRNSPARALFHLDDEVLIDLDPGLVTWRAAGCEVTETAPVAAPAIADASSF